MEGPAAPEAAGIVSVSSKLCQAGVALSGREAEFAKVGSGLQLAYSWRLSGGAAVLAGGVVYWAAWLRGGCQEVQRLWRGERCTAPHGGGTLVQEQTAARLS